MTLETALHEFTVVVDESRLDQFLAGQDTGLTRSQLQKLIVDERVLVNGRLAKPSGKVRAVDLVSLSVPPPRPSGLVAQDIPVTVVYQDAELVVIDKPIYLMELDILKGGANAASDLDLFMSYEVINDA